MRCLLLALLLASSAQAQISLSSEPLVRGQAVTVSLGAPSDSLVVTYRPNSGISVSETLPVTGSTAQWVPSRAGVVSLEAADGTSANVSVRFDRTPISGLLILILAGLILFGGAAFAMRALLSGGPPATADSIEHWPDT